MTPEQLKASILQYAIQGKLVEQRPEEGTAEELYQQIQEEMQRLIKEGKIKKEKPLDEITEDEILFDIPDSWKWVRIGNTCVGFEYGTAKKSLPKGKRAVLRMGNIKNGKVIYDNLVYSNDNSDIDKYNLEYGDLLFNRTNSKEWVGKTAIYEGDIPAIYAGYLVRFKPVLLDSYYLNFVMQTRYYWGFCQRERTDAIGQSNINAQKLKTFAFPLPPLEEQQRIVAKIEELLPCVDRYAKAYEKLEQFNAKFPEDMKKSILQYAIQGKLVEQRPEEGTAEELHKQIQEEKQRLIKEGKIKKEKPLAEISEDEIPFDIPDSWKWCYLGELFSHTAGKALNSKNTNGTKHKYITTSNVYWDHFELDNLKEMYYTEDEIDKYSVKKGDLLVLEGGDVGRSAIWDLQESYCIQNHIHRLRPYSSVDVKYFYYAMMYFKLKGDIAGRGIGIKGLSANALHCIYIPLPPLEEQHRIVAKIEELLPYCDRMVK